MSRNRYLVENPLGVLYLRVLDGLLSLLPRPAAKPRTVSRLLVGIGGHLGDAVIATSVLRSIAMAHPELEIGIAAPGWVADLFRNQPRVFRIHAIDHWKLNRAPSRLLRVKRWLGSTRSAVREIRKTGYDASVDLYPYYPSMSVAFARARIPIRAGFETAGGAPLLTHPVALPDLPIHQAGIQIRAAEAILGSLPAPTRYELPPPATDVVVSAERLLSTAGTSGPYVVIHPGTGDPSKQWDLDRWVVVASELTRRGVSVVLTGAGRPETVAGTFIAARAPGTIDLTGRTTLDELRAVLAGAEVVVACDSAAGHLAAAEGVPVVSLMLGVAPAARWRPLASRGIVLLGNSRKRIEPQDVITAIEHARGMDAHA